MIEQDNFEKSEEFDKLKTQAFKYILCAKRTEKNVRNRFRKEENSKVDILIEYLKEQNYINDYEYIVKTVKEYKKIKNMSMKEVIYKLGINGVEKDLIDEYMSKNYNDVLNFEIQSAKNIVSKQLTEKSKEEIINFLYKKGYAEDTIRMMKFENSN